MNMGDFIEVAESLFRQIELLKPLLVIDLQKYEPMINELKKQQKEHWMTEMDPCSFHLALHKIYKLD